MSPILKRSQRARKRSPVSVLLIAFVLASAPVLLLQSPAHAQQGDHAKLREYDIPAGPLDEALIRLVETSGVFLAGDADLAAGLRTSGLEGSYTVEQALERLLAGSGLRHRFTSADTVTLEPAAAQPESGPIRLDPLLVTGERVERSVFETPTSVVVVPGAEIEKTPTFNDVENVLDFVPNIVTAGTSNLGAAIRGIDTTGVLNGGAAVFGGARPRTTITVDGRPLSFNEYIFGETSLWDLERVEVFRGPQTTAQGANSIAGATYLVTADPTFEPEAKAQGEIGSDERRRLSAAVSGPIVADKLAGRIAVNYQRRDSFVDFDVKPEDGPNPNEFENIVTRAKLLWEPENLPEFSTKLTFSFTQNEAPQSELVGPPNRDLEGVIFASFRTTAYTGLHDISYAFSDNLEISNRFSVTGTEIERFTPDSPGTGDGEFDGLQLINETILTWGLPALDLNGIFGVYYQGDRVTEKIDFSDSMGLGDFDDTQTGLGLFGEATYQVTDRLDLTAGLRYQRDKQERNGSLGVFTVDFNGTFDALLPKFVIGYDVTDDLRIGAMAVRGFNPGGTTLFFSDGSQDTFEDETVWNFEAFGRALLLDDRLALNANAFYSMYEDFQFFTIRGFDPVGNPEFAIENADRAITYGLEFSADFRATEDLRVFGGLGLLDSEIVKFSDSAEPGIEGNQFARAPHVTLSAGADYEVIDNLTLGSRVRYVGSYFSDAETNSSETKAGDYAVVDFQLSYAYENVEAYAFVNNAFDEFYRIFDTGVMGRAFVGTPREYGVGLRVSF